MYCLCVNVYCHRVTTQLQLTNILYHIKWMYSVSVQVGQLLLVICGAWKRTYFLNLRCGGARNTLYVMQVLILQNKDKL